MRNGKAVYLRPSPEETVRLLQQELADTNSEVLLLRSWKSAWPTWKKPTVCCDVIAN